MRPLPALVLAPLAAALLAAPGPELWVELSAVAWPPVDATVYRRAQLASECQCRAACAADPHCQALHVRRLSEGGAACRLASRRRGAAEPVEPLPEDSWFERAGPPAPEEICWPAEGGCRPPTDCAEATARSRQRWPTRRPPEPRRCWSPKAVMGC